MFLKFKDLKKIDKKLFINMLILLVIGLLLVQSSSSVEGLTDHGDGYYFAKRQLSYIIIGFISIFITVFLNHKIYKKLSPLIYIIAVVLNLLLYTSLGSDRYGSTRWLDIGGLPSFMPSELLKLASVIFLAAILSQMGRKIRKPGQFIFVSLFIAFSVLIVMSKDLGSSIVIAFSLMAMLLISGAKISHLFILCILAIILVFFMIFSPRYAYRRERLTSFLDPFNPDRDTYHIKNILYAVAMGGILGQGLGQGVQKFAHIPNVFSDSIFAVAAEELGLLGLILIILLYGNLVYRSFKIASKAKDQFSKLLAAGFATSLGFQTLLHIMVNIGLAPITGITLPFLSYGGTSIVVSMTMIGILLNISAQEE